LEINQQLESGVVSIAFNKIMSIVVPHSSRRSRYHGVARDVYFPTGMAYIVGAIDQAFPNVEQVVFDTNVYGMNGEILDDFVNCTYGDSGPNLVMFGAISTNYKVVKELVSLVKKRLPEAKIVCGGTIATLHPEIMLRKIGVDYCVIEEGEVTIIDLLKNLDDPKDVLGIAFIENDGQYKRTPARPRLKTIGDDVIHAYKYFDVESYVQSYQRSCGFRGLHVSASRGCVYACKFCFRGLTAQVEYRNSSSLANEVQWLKNEFNIEAFSLSDELPWADKHWMKEFADCLLERNLSLLWQTSGRVNQFAPKDEDLFRYMFKAGLRRVSFGLESASDTMIENMGKTKGGPERAEKAFRTLRKVGIKVSCSILMGFPGETPDTIRETVEFLRRNLITMRSFFLLQPFPGTPVYETHVRSDTGEEEWLEKYSQAGDAGEFVLNLTDMEQGELLKHVEWGESQVQKRSLFHYLKYYSIKDLPKQIAVDIWRFIRMKYYGTLFETP
jgi:anaerobic magnesium-protoporphyrin IX monomethyl ester cyclase